MPRVLVLTRYERLGASSRIRFLQFLPFLEAQGFSFDVAPLLDNAYVGALYGGPRVGAGHLIGAYVRRLRALMRRRSYDVVWLEKEALPWLPAFFEQALLSGIPYVADYDDAWFHRYDSHASPLVRNLLGTKIDRVMHGAHTVVAGNDYLADRARKSGARRIEIIPTAIDLDRYPDQAPAPAHAAAVVGWIGIPLNAHYLDIVAPALLADHERLKLHVVGAPIPPALAGAAAESFPWSEASEIERIGAFDVGIMPLRDTPWERGKCAYKLLQVMAAGRPVIASPVGANRQVVQDGVNGFLADTPEQWAEALRRLGSDSQLRRRMGEAARRTVAERYSVASVRGRLATVLKDAVGAA